jgi:hypothetical protein
MHEALTVLGVWGHGARGCLLEAFDDRRLASAIVPDYQGQRRAEVERPVVVRAETADPADEKLLDGAHAALCCAFNSPARLLVAKACQSRSCASPAEQAPALALRNPMSRTTHVHRRTQHFRLS